MKRTNVLFLVLSLIMLFTCGCGKEQNGDLSVSGSSDGSFITASAIYTNPTSPSPSGVPVTFTIQIGSVVIPGGTSPTVSGRADMQPILVSTLPAFAGSQGVIISAKTGDIVRYAGAFSLSGTRVEITPPVFGAFSTASTAPTTQNLTLPAGRSFVTFTNPFGTAGSPIRVQATVTAASNPAVDRFVFNNNSTAITVRPGATGIVFFPGGTATLQTPGTVGGVETMTITWTATEAFTRATRTASSTVTLTKTR